MRCDNCRCIVPDTCEYCMYCGHKVNTGVEKTIPVGSQTEKVTYYKTFPNAPETQREPRQNIPPQPPRWGGNNGYNDYNVYRDSCVYRDAYSQRRYDYPDYSYYGGASYDRGRADYTYRTVNRTYDDYARYNGYNVYDPRYDYSNYANYNNVNNDNKAKFTKLLLGVVAVDLVFMLIVLMLLLLVKI